MVQAMTTTVDLRPLPLNCVLVVAGVSFRQDVVAAVVEEDELRIRHDLENAHDPHACRVETLTGELLGYVPKGLAPRLSGPHPGGLWRAKVAEVLPGPEATGLRVRLGPLVVDGLPPAPGGADAPGLRHHDDGVLDFAQGGVVLTEPGQSTLSGASPRSASADPVTRVVGTSTASSDDAHIPDLRDAPDRSDTSPISDSTSLSDSTEISSSADSAVGPAVADSGAVPWVSARSGRVLGRLVGVTGDRVLVLGAAGGRVSYPAGVVTIHHP
jgi:hypothetical protein